MTLTTLIAEEAQGRRARIVAAAAFVGVTNAAIVALVNSIAQRTSGGATLTDFGVFAASIALYVACSWYTFHQVSATVENALHRIKVRILEKIERANLENIERIGTAEIYDRITANVSRISTSTTLISAMLQSVFIAVVAGIYVAILSVPAFLVLAVIFGGGIGLFYHRATAVAQSLSYTATVRLGLLDQLTDLLRGFKEVKLNRQRGGALRADLQESSGVLRDVTTQSSHDFHDNWLFMQSIQYIGLGAILFILPQFVTVEAATQRLLIGGVLFAWGPLVTSIAGFPAYLEANTALANIAALEQKLDQAGTETASAASPPGTDSAWHGQLTQSIEAKNLEYEYQADGGSEVFHIGPMNLTIAAGEIVFIVGGNGSGKSTFLKVLTGLYPPRAGTLRVDGITVRPANVAAYRELVSSIYSDFHIFSKLYGVLGAPESAVHRLLEQLQIQDKTAFADDRFTKPDLSTGQRKRLAMIVTLLEDRPLCVFDEWAADQDPEFRKYFYEELLPALKKRGKTILAVSHDDRYFHCADRIVTLEYGQIRSVEVGADNFTATAAHAAELPSV